MSYLQYSFEKYCHWGKLGKYISDLYYFSVMSTYNCLKNIQRKLIWKVGDVLIMNFSYYFTSSMNQYYFDEKKTIFP